MEALKTILPRINGLAPSSNLFDPNERERKRAEDYNAMDGGEDKVTGYNCTICKNKETVARVEEYNGSLIQIYRDCECKKTRNTIRRLQRSGLKNIIKDYTFAKYEATEEWQQKIKAEAVAYAADPVGWFFIGGQSGSGKTHICTAICRKFILEGREVVYMLWRDEIGPLKGVANDADRQAELISKYKTAEVLYIDDLFKTGKGADKTAQRPTSADINVAFEILNYRGINKLPTVISSESTITDLLDIDEATAGRIVEYSRNPFSLKPDRKRNYRMRKAAEI